MADEAEIQGIRAELAELRAEVEILKLQRNAAALIERQAYLIRIGQLERELGLERTREPNHERRLQSKQK